MMQQNEIEEINKLIKDGFDLELISFELDIPIERVIQCKKDLEESRRIYNLNSMHQRFKKMHGKYQKLFFKRNIVQKEQTEPLSEQETEIIETVIESIKSKINEMYNLSNEDKISNARNILLELEKIERFQLSIEQAEELNNLLSSHELKELKTSRTDKLSSALQKSRRGMITQLARAINIKQEQIENIDELKFLNRKLTTELLNEEPMSTGGVKSSITNKILRIQRNNAIDRIKNDISEEILSIIVDLANGNANIQEAKNIILEEAKKRVEGKPKTKFSLTEEQEKRQIILQIGTILKEQVDKYKIEKPNDTIIQLQKLYDGDLGEAMNIVIGNLLLNKDYKTAKEICDKFSREYRGTELSKHVLKFKRKIRNAEFSDLILKGIDTAKTPEDERAFISFVEKGLRQGNIKMEEILLGKSRDGIRTITLADIWVDEQIKQR